MKAIAFIPARGGSKRLPRKNIADFLGKPIIAWTIEAALKTAIFEKVIVSTDDEEISDISRRYGAETEWRRPEMALDHVSTIDLWLDYLENNPGWDVFSCLYATAPLRTAEDIKKTVALLEPGVCDFAVAVTHFDLPVHQALWRGADGNLRPVLPDLVEKQSNDIQEIVVDNGSTYALNTRAFLERRKFFGGNLRAYVMPRERSQDIDEAVDLDLARFFGKRLGMGQ